jgi:hypothetical protein
MFKKAGKGKAIRRKIETDDVDDQPEGTFESHYLWLVQYHREHVLTVLALNGTAEIEESVVKRTNLKKKKGTSSKKSLALSFDQEVGFLFPVVSCHSMRSYTFNRMKAMGKFSNLKKVTRVSG